MYCVIVVGLSFAQIKTLVRKACHGGIFVILPPVMFQIRSRFTAKYSLLYQMTEHCDRYYVQNQSVYQVSWITSTFSLLLSVKQKC